jgi:hypothetical protein
MHAPWLEYQSVSSARSAWQTHLRLPFIGQSHHGRRHSLRAQSLLEIRYEMSNWCSLQAFRLVIAICISRTVFCLYDGPGTSLKSTQGTMMNAGVRLRRKCLGETTENSMRTVVMTGKPFALPRWRINLQLFSDYCTTRRED